MDFDPGTSHATSEEGQQFTDELTDANIADVRKGFDGWFQRALDIEEQEQEGAA